MVALPAPPDPTLEAVDRAIEMRENVGRRGRSLPMGSIGYPCDRALFYAFRWAGEPKSFPADVLKKFADGHHGEDVQAARLRLVEGIELWTVDPETGGQYAVSDCEGHLQGRIDGVILGLLQAPMTPHVWEHKQTELQSKLEQLKAEAGEKHALFQWNPRYWATAQLYMRYTELDRHYMTVASPGGRRTVSVRTDYDQHYADQYAARARYIIYANRAPARISENPAWHECRWCDFYAICHQEAMPARNCRTCMASTPVADGGWRCDRWDKPLSYEEQQKGCNDHLFLPSLIPGEQVDAADDGTWVEYLMADGVVWRNEVVR
jgi:hypothetical protein